MAEPNTLMCEVFLAQGPVQKVRAQSVIFPGPDGLIGILANRAPLVSAMGSGTLTVRAAGGDRCYRVSGGFACMRGNVLTVMAEQCRPLESPQLRWSQRP